jgi:hypothetical protein
LVPKIMGTSSTLSVTIFFSCLLSTQCAALKRTKTYLFLPQIVKYV